MMENGELGDTLDILISPEQIDFAEEHGQIIINYNAKGKPVEIEILNASRFLGNLLTGIVKAKTKAEIEEVEITS